MATCVARHGTRPACGDGWAGRFARLFSGCGCDRCQCVRCSTGCFEFQCLVGSVAERLCSGVAAAAKEDLRLVGEVVFVSVGVDDSRGPLDHVGAVVLGCDLDRGQGFPPRECLGWRQVGRLPAGRRSWGAEDLHPVLRADGEEPRHVRRGFERRWQNAFEGGLTDLSQESFE